MPSLFKSKGASAKDGGSAPSSSRNSDYNGAAAPPPAYAETETNGASVADGTVPSDQRPPEAPPVDITAAFANLRLSNAPRDPDTDTCLAHLKLLAAFQNLKEDVGYTDGLWNLWDTRAENANLIVDDSGLNPHVTVEEQLVSDPSTRTTDEKMAFLSKLREKRWAVFVARAVDRYEAWWTTLYVPSMVEQHMMTPGDPNYETFPHYKDGLIWTPAMLPPLDVLMVFHSHMLNPRAFLEDAMRHKARMLWATGFPWEQVNAAIDTAFNYNASPDAKAAWVALTGRAWENTDDPLSKRLRCPACRADLTIPWTTCGLEENPKTEQRPGLVGQGYGDGRMSTICPACGVSITKELLSVAKFVDDCKALVQRGTPMPGTLLEPKTGLPEVVPFGFAGQSHGRTFPNRLVKKSLVVHVLALIKPGINPAPDMVAVRDLISGKLESQGVIKMLDGLNTSVADIRRHRIHPTAKVCVRKMMSRYWENFSPFALDLSGAVMRQGIFVEKMCKIDWLHSPSAPETMGRLLKKYTRFFSIMAANPLRVAVPTLDVDLAWHTHQLSPAAYFKYSTRQTAKFIDHDDKMDEDKLSASFEWTSKEYQSRYNEVYSECTCWYCETVRSSHVSSVGKLLGVSQQEKVSENFHATGAARLCPPDNSAHISAHNAVKTVLPDSEEARKKVLDRLRLLHQAKLDENYAKACRRAERKGRKLPPKEQYYDHWGYSYYMYAPFYYPMYLAPGMYYGYYGPGYVSAGDGAWANCAQGSCGNNGVASGACGGPGGCGNMGGCGAGGDISGGSCGSGGGCGGGGGGGGCGGGGGGGGGGCGGGGS